MLSTRSGASSARRGAGAPANADDGSALRGSGSPVRRMLIAGPAVAVVSILAALLTTSAAGVPLRDPDHVAGRRLVIVLGFVAALLALDVVVRAGRRSGTWRPSRAALAGVWRERWTLR